MAPLPGSPILRPQPPAAFSSPFRFRIRTMEPVPQTAISPGRPRVSPARAAERSLVSISLVPGGRTARKASRIPSGAGPSSAAHPAQTFTVTPGFPGRSCRIRSRKRSVHASSPSFSQFMPRPSARRRIRPSLRTRTAVVRVPPPSMPIYRSVMPVPSFSPASVRIPRRKEAPVPDYRLKTGETNTW